MPPEIEAIKHVGDWVDGKLVCRPDCPSITHKTNMTHNTDIEEVVEDTRTKLNKAYLRLAYGKSDITKTKQEVNNILTTYRTTILKEVGEGLETVKITAIRRSEDDPRIQQAKMAQVLYDRDIKPALLKKLFSN